MKSVLSILPIVGLVVAKEPCSQETFTKTITNKITVTVPAPSSSSIAASTSAAGLGSTTVIQKTVYVTPSPVPTFHPYYNGTFNGTLNHTAQAPTTFSTVSLPLLSSSAVEMEASSVGSSSSSEAAAIPTSETPASSYAASTTSSSPAATPTTPTDNAGGNSGEATFYGGNVSGGMCSFTGYTIPSGVYGTALSDSNWDDGANCGACVSVTGPDGNSITAMIVDQCPGCGTNHLDLFPDAFSSLADPSKGVIPVTWSFVECGISSPITLKNKEGTSPYWFAMQVENSNVAVSTLDVSTDGGSTWQPTTRTEYNFFENDSGFGTDSVDVKVTSNDGQSMTVKGVSVAASSKKTTSGNF